jgi:hypothetical protein
MHGGVGPSPPVTDGGTTDTMSRRDLIDVLGKLGAGALAAAMTGGLVGATAAATSQSGRPDSNRRPQRPERCALPNCATSRRERRSYLLGAGRSPGFTSPGRWRSPT